jgi:hypothetical protein
MEQLQSAYSHTLSAPKIRSPIARCDISSCTGRAPKNHARKIKDLVSYTEDETTAKSYDKQMRDRFKETINTLESVIMIKQTHTMCADIIAKCYGVNIMDDLIKSSVSTCNELEETLSKYDLTVIAHLMNGMSGANDIKYFAAVSCENIDSLLLSICTQMRNKISAINGVIIKIKDIMRKHVAHEMIYSQQTRKNSNTFVIENEGIAQSVTRVLGSGRGRGVMRVSAVAKKTAIRNARARKLIIDAQQKNEIPVLYMTPELIIKVCSDCVDEDELIRSFNHTFITLNTICEQFDAIIELSYPIYKGPEDDKKCAYCKGHNLHKVCRGGDTICETCGHIVQSSTASANAAQDEQGTGRAIDGSRSKYNGYNYTRHLRLWMDRLQAIESFTFNADDIKRVRNSIISEYMRESDINWGMLQCMDIERHLSLCGLTLLNEHAPKLIKELGGRAPPILNYDTLQIITCDFVRIMEIYSQLFEETGNKPYYPFFIAKIIKLRFKKNDEILRILNYVSHQGYDTVAKNDRIYQCICAHAPPEYHLVFEPETE